MNFSEKLKEIRKTEGLSQEQLAEKIGVSRQAITKWETGKGLPDIENMTILAEIFKMTIDELVNESAARTENPCVYSSETVYDIDREKHFDIHIGSANFILLSSGSDEKLHVYLKSDSLENLGGLFKVKLDENRNRLDVDFVKNREISRFEAEETLGIQIVLPEKYAEHCEIAASVKLLELSGLHIPRLEYDGGAERIVLKNSSGSFEFTSKTDYEITADKIAGQLSLYQFHAKSLLHIAEGVCPEVKNTGKKCTVVFMKGGEKTAFQAAGSEGEIRITGIGSELVVDLSAE